MSLFGAPQAQQQQQQQQQQQPQQGTNTGSSLFPSTNQPSNTPSLFGSLNTNQPRPLNLSGSTLFGSNASQQPQSANNGSSLFGQTNTAQGQQQQQQQNPSGSLFGGLGGSQLQQTNTNTTGNSLFGGASLSQPAQQQQQQQHIQQTQQHQNAAPATTGPLGGASTAFGSSLLNASTQKLAQSQTPVSAQNARFQTLLEKSKKRQLPGEDNSQFGDLPSLQLGLGDISSKLRNLGGRDASVKASQRGSGESRAQYLLAASGVPRAATLRDLHTFKTQAGAAAAQPPVPAADTDLDTFVAELRAKSTADLMAESLEEAKREFDAFVEDNLQVNWDEQRRRVYEHFGLAMPQESLNDSIGPLGAGPGRGSFGRSTRKGQTSFANSAMSRSVLGGSVGRGSVRGSLFTDVADHKSTSYVQSAPEDPFLRNKQENYAAKVNELNSARLQDLVYPVIEEFARVELAGGNDTPAHLVDAYRVLKEIVRENSNAQRPSEPGAVRERQYANDYLDPVESSAKAAAIRKQILDGSRKFLEESFFHQMDGLVAKNPKEANLGGVPSKVNKVRAFIRIQAARKDFGVDTTELQMLGDDYCWALIFYLLRAGLVQEAARYVADNDRAIKSMDRNFAQYITAYANDSDRRLPRDMQAKINLEYQQRTRLAPENSIDPFRMACYKIIGRCDLAKKAIDGIKTTMEDWVWLLFSLAREVNRVEETAGETFGLLETRALIEEIGERHFSNQAESATAYATYFFLQVAAGSFERAVAWLYPHNYVAAVHFAIALNFYGLLKVSDFSTSESLLLTYDTRGRPQISFGRLIGYYTRDFRLVQAEAATDYLTLICLNADLPGEQGRSQATVCHEALKELVLETREFALLLGDILHDGRKLKGAIEQRLALINLSNDDDYLRNLTLQAAAVANESGRITDSVLLYHLAEDYDNVVTIINWALSDAIAVDIEQEPMRLQALKPRSKAEAQQPSTAGAGSTLSASSLSLTATDSPADLARAMMGMYAANALYYKRVRQENRDACAMLQALAAIKPTVAAGRWSEAIAQIEALGILPMTANSNVSAIRSAASNFNALPDVVAKNIGNLLVWTIRCCGEQRRALRASQFQAKEVLADELLAKAKDLMVFAGLIRYRLPADVFEVLARAGQNL